jgi:endonuclease/exonuclease/phosphatase (EEP) superfamily protein YafD
VLYGTAYLPLRCWVGADIGSDHRPLLAEFR